MTEAKRRSICKNRRARFDYQIEETFEAGIVLLGSEVKSLREGRANLVDSYARISDGEVFLMKAHIAPYEQANRENHDPVRPRKLLLHRSEIRRLTGKVHERGRTLIPLELYFERGRAKVELALARGKKRHDKRAAIAKRESDRQLQRITKREARRG
ncbi:MAG: SsrA-binding protein SmpB [Myxococcota bacterium]